MRRLAPLLLLGLVLLGVWWLRHPPPRQMEPVAIERIPAAALPTTTQTSLPGYLPPEAHTTLSLIARGGPFPHPQDGSVFGNRERLLPEQPRGYYHEYTVDTPNLNHRGARRIITGGQPPVTYYYTDDHYQSFRSFTLPQ